MLSHCDTYRFCHFSFSILIDSDEEPLVPIEAEDSESDVCSYLYLVTMPLKDRIINIIILS